MYIDETFLTTALPHAVILQGKLPSSASFSIDSRTVQPDEIFVALAGRHHDGHDFLAAVLERDVAGFIIDERKQEKLKTLSQEKLRDKVIIAVADPLQALISLARAYRAQFTIPIVAITGSIGKTSTKYILAALLNHTRDDYFVSHGNQNTLLGVSLNILRLMPHHAGAIFEVGISQRGEMARLADLLRPTLALITCIGHSHMEGLGSMADIAAEKRAIFKYLSEGSVGFVFGDQPIIAQVSYPHPVVKFGLKTINQIQARKIKMVDSKTSCILKIYGEKYPIVLPNNHAGTVLNSLAAISVAHHIGVPISVIIERIQQPVIVSGRFEQKKLSHYPAIIINDCYNASPESMKAALLAFQKIETSSQKIAILGDMLELGSDSAFWHRQLGRFLRKVPTLKQLFLVGSQVQWIKKTMPSSVSVELVPTWQDLLPKVKECVKNDTLILVKGSRGMGLTQLVEQLLQAP